MNEGAINAHFLTDAVIYLGFGLVFVLIFRRLGLGAVLGFLVSGAVIGPPGLGLVGDVDRTMAVAEIGVVLLLFVVGLELNPARLWRMRRDIFGLGLAQVILCGAALALFLDNLTALTLAAAIAVGLPLALSSTAQVLPMLQERGRLNTPFGERSFAVLLFQDLAIVPMITIIAALSRAPADPSAPPGWMLALYTVGAVIGLVLAGRFLLNPLLRLIGRAGQRELFIVAGLFTVLAAAALMEALHLSTALGAFVAGVMLADSPYRHELEADIEPFRAILLGLFFIAVGMQLDLATIAARPLLVVGLAAGLILIKTLVIGGLARLFGMETRSAFALGLLLSQGGELGFVLFAQARDALLIDPDAASLFGAVVTLSMAATPLLMAAIRRFSPDMRGSDAAELDTPEGAPDTRAIVIGYGRFGQTVSQMLMAEGVSVTLIDSNPRQIELSAGYDMKVWYGDGRRLDLLRQAGAGQANLIAFCASGAWLSSALLRQIRAAFPQASVVARAYDRTQFVGLAKAEVDDVVRELFESAVLLGRRALERLGVSNDRIDRIEAEYRRRDDARLERQIDSGDMKSGLGLMFRPEAPWTGEKSP